VLDLSIDRSKTGPRLLKDEEIDALVDSVCNSKSLNNPLESALIPILQDIQKEVGFLPQRDLQRVSAHLRVGLHFCKG